MSCVHHVTCVWCYCFYEIDQFSITLYGNCLWLASIGDGVITIIVYQIDVETKVTKASNREAVANIDDFVPDEEIDTNFLTEEADEEHNKLFKKERCVYSVQYNII